MANATRNQLFALWADTGKTLELRNMGDLLSFDTAKDMLSRLRDKKINPKVIHTELLALGAELKGAPVKTDTKPKINFQAVYNEADKAGKAAAASCRPTPMIVEQHANMGDDRSPVVKQYHVPQGVCGFAWVKFAGNTAWAKWCKSKNLAHQAYPTGLSIYVHDFGQSMELKEAYAFAFAGVLNAHGIKAYAQSRID